MASSGKKGKKNKGKAVSLQSFLSNGESQPGTTQVTKKIRNIDGDDSDEGSNSLPVILQLPTEPRANRMLDDDSIPHKPPYIAYITNLPFDVNEEDIYEFFETQCISSLRLPREDGETGRVRGFGYITMENRDDLIHILSLPDPVMKGRRIRIELSNENEQQNNKQRNNRRGFDGFNNNNDNRDSTNWRRDNQDVASSGNGYERGGFNRDRKPVERSEESSAPGSWRMGTRPVVTESPRSDSGNEIRRDIVQRNRNIEREERDRGGSSYHNEEEIVQERPRLNLKPRTLPLPEIILKPDELDQADDTKTVKAGGVSSEKVFGSAKPVDTAARELEIEKRLSEERRLEIHDELDDVNEKLSETHLEKVDKNNANSAISWRRNEPIENRDEGKKYSPDRKDDRRRDNKTRDFNRYKSREKNDRSEPARVRPNQQRDVRNKDDKTKRDTKMERPLPKLQSNPPDPVLQSANKYSGLDDEASE